MKVKLCSLIASVILVSSFSPSADATLILYEDLPDFEETFIGDLSFRLEGPQTLEEAIANDESVNIIPGPGNSFTMWFLEDNTAFAANFNVDEADTAYFEVFDRSGNILPITIPARGKEGKKNYKPEEIVSTFFIPGDGFFGVRGDDNIGRVEVWDASVDQIWHNNPVPEPATLLLLGAGLAGMAVFRRKFRKK